MTKSAIDKVRQALEFFANPKSYEYSDKTGACGDPECCTPCETYDVIEHGKDLAEQAIALLTGIEETIATLETDATHTIEQLRDRIKEMLPNCLPMEMLPEGWCVLKITGADCLSEKWGCWLMPRRTWYRRIADLLGRDAAKDVLGIGDNPNEAFKNAIKEIRK